MAKSFYNAFGRWRGSAGSKTFSVLFGNQVIKERQGKRKFTPNEAQAVAQARFALLVHMADAFEPALELGYARAARGRMFTRNMFTRENYGNVTGTTPDNVHIDPTKIRISKGNLPGVVFSSAIGTSTPGTVTVSVTDVNLVGKATDEDNIYVLVYCPDALKYGAGILSAPARRTEGATLSVRYPMSWSGLEVHVYGFVMGGGKKTKGKASESEYVGHAELG